MKILITGGTGFLGRHLVWRFASEGHSVVFSGRNAALARDIQSRAGGDSQYIFHEHGNSETLINFNRAAKESDALVHCAALSSPWGDYKDFWRANVISTEEVLALCKMEGIARLVHISTPSLYFRFCDQLHLREDSPLPAPVNAYAETKGIAEQRVLAAEIPGKIILRPRALFGPWDQAIMPRILRVMRSGRFPVTRKGQALIDITYIDNVVDAVVMAVAASAEKKQGIYNVSNGEPMTVNSLLRSVSREFNLPLRTLPLPWPALRSVALGMELLSGLTKKEPFITRYSAGLLAFSQTLDISAIRKDLNYHPRISITEGLARHAAWYQMQQNKSA